MLKLHPTLSLSTLEESMVPIEGGVMEIQGVNIQLDDFELCRYPVSQQLWKEVIGDFPKKIRFPNLNRPIEMVSRNEIQDKFLPILRERTKNKRWCLTTEVQWEYAARGGKYARAHIYRGLEQLKGVGWYDDNSFSETHPFACKRPNTLGLYDMSGNIFEWCQDWYDSSYYQTLKDQYIDQPAPNPGGPEEGNRRVVRGGSWYSDSTLARVSNRVDVNPVNRFGYVGFRLCRYSAH